MPAFTQIFSDPLDTTVACTCSWQEEEGAMPLDSDNGTFMHINGIRHWATCALSMSAHSSTTLLKQQQQNRGKQRLRQLGQDEDGDGDMEEDGTTLLRKPPPSRYRREAFDPVRLLPTTAFHLFPGSKFKGKQKSGSSCYDVMVDIKVRTKAYSWSPWSPWPLLVVINLPSPQVCACGHDSQRECVCVFVHEGALRREKRKGWSHLIGLLFIQGLTQFYLPHKSRRNGFGPNTTLSFFVPLLFLACQLERLFVMWLPAHQWPDRRIPRADHFL